MPCYDYVCEDCMIRWEVLRPVSERNVPTYCPECHNSENTHLKIMTGPRLMNRSKPGSYQFNPGKLDGDDDRLHAFRTAEAQGPEKFKELKEAFGPQIYQETMTHYKEKYAS